MNTRENTLFFQVKTSEEVFELLKEFKSVDKETVSLKDALGRVLGQSIIAPEDLPGFSRSTMDGYAVRARDTFGATEAIPSFLEVEGEVSMGLAPNLTVTEGKTVRISTGGMLPEGADGVVMIEHCHPLDDRTIEVSRAVSPLENVIRPGDDLKAGTEIFKTGHVLRPQDLGILAGLGLKDMAAYRRPRVAIISTGDEVIPLDQRPLPGQVRDINSYTLTAFCTQSGAIPINLGVCKDRFPELRETVVKGLQECDTLWISGGSSVGARDLTVKVLESLDDMELLVHGISISPGKPTILARTGDKAVFGLPGHTAAVMVIAEVFLRPFLSGLSGETGTAGDNRLYIKAELSSNIESAGGRDDYIRVRLEKRDRGYLAEPIHGKSGLISTLVEAHGLLKIDRNTEGLYKGQAVDVMLFGPFKGMTG